MNREKQDAKGLVSPLTPALSPLRGEGEEQSDSSQQIVEPFAFEAIC